MSLTDLIRGTKTDATATHATLATVSRENCPSVAKVATVAVANAQKFKIAQFTPEADQAIRTWLYRIEEYDPVIIEEVIEKCRNSAEACEFYLKRAVNSTIAV